MELTKFISKEQRKVLAEARKTYGDTNQILVSTEELNELAAVCTKFPRYDTKEEAQDALYKKAVDEVADVLIVLDHIVNIFGLTPIDIGTRVEAKINRLQRWLSKSEKISQTTVDRSVEEASCKTCVHNTCSRSEYPCDVCGSNRPMYRKKFPCDSCKNKGDFINILPGGICAECAKTDGSKYSPMAGDIE